ncbi:MAG TPA: hypothetical protein VN851_23650 [Thermoanaerobaculia bacterium]|nr:hypothetical protein [Thermoanaerobaculia bacterium]
MRTAQISWGKFADEQVKAWSVLRLAPTELRLTPSDLRTAQIWMREIRSELRTAASRLWVIESLRREVVSCDRGFGTEPIGLQTSRQ